jgi:hypothetical protein
MIQQYHSWAYTRRNISQDTKEPLAHTFIVAPFIIAKLWK